MANNTWKNYTQKDTTLLDNDEVMLLDSTDEKNKRGLMSKFWDYVVDKMATAVIGKLETENKTVIGAINALNSDKVNYGSYAGDLNNIPVIVNKQTIYRVIPNCKNSPTPGEHGILRTMYIDNSKYAIQEFLSHANTKLFIRSKSNDVWGNWVEK
nr:MAG TPA_asm: hypothetical protein [Caudoviricetes sp.]